MYLLYVVLKFPNVRAIKFLTVSGEINSSNIFFNAILNINESTYR